MEQIINYRDIPTDKRIDILNALERIGFFPAYGGVRTMQQIMEKSVPGSGPQFYFVFRENELIGYNFLIGDTKKYKAFPWLAISNIDEQKLTVCEELMKIQIAFFEELGMQKIADHCVRIMEDYRKGIGSAIRPKKPTLQRERPVSGVTATQQTATASEQPMKSSKPPKADRSTLKKWRT